MSDLSDRINAEIKRRLKTDQDEVDYFICLMAQNDAQSQERIAALEFELTALRAANAEMREALLGDHAITAAVIAHCEATFTGEHAKCHCRAAGKLINGCDTISAPKMVLAFHAASNQTAAVPGR